MIEDDDQEVPVERFTCKKCGKHLSRAMFDTYRAKGKVGVCKTCHACRMEQIRAWNRANYDKRIESERRSRNRRRAENSERYHNIRAAASRRCRYRANYAKRLQIEALTERGYRTTPELTTRYPISPQGLTSAARRGAIESIKVGSDWFISEESLKCYLFRGKGKQ